MIKIAHISFRDNRKIELFWLDKYFHINLSNRVDNEYIFYVINSLRVDIYYLFA